MLAAQVTVSLSNRSQFVDEFASQNRHSDIQMSLLAPRHAKVGGMLCNEVLVFATVIRYQSLELALTLKWKGLFEVASSHEVEYSMETCREVETIDSLGCSRYMHLYSQKSFCYPKISPFYIH